MHVNNQGVGAKLQILRPFAGEMGRSLFRLLVQRRRGESQYWEVRFIVLHCTCYHIDVMSPVQKRILLYCPIDPTATCHLLS
jgi:hypothetical protein